MRHWSVTRTTTVVWRAIGTEILDAFESAGPDNFMVMPFDFSEARLISNRPPWWGKPEITNEEIRRIAALPGVAEAIVSFDFNTNLDYEGDRARGVSTTGSEVKDSAGGGGGSVSATLAAGACGSGGGAAGAIAGSAGGAASGSAGGSDTAAC